MAGRGSRRWLVGGIALWLAASGAMAQNAADVRRELNELRTRMETLFLREAWSEIEEAASRVIEIADTDERRARGFADRSLANLGGMRPRQALVDIERAIELDPAKAEWLARRGEVYWTLNRRDEARRDYEAALEKDANDFTAKQGLARMGIRR
ncbi:MAG: tetratricopeptide repeat protein [Alphaproteobacteria bacterium]|nr:tetratricopeptide repeat protein [Alphaproteobacteria bacterium]